MDADNSWHPLNIITMKTRNDYILSESDDMYVSVSKTIYDTVKVTMMENDIKIKEKVSVHVFLDANESEKGEPTLSEIYIRHNLHVNTFHF